MRQNEDKWGKAHTLHTIASKKRKKKRTLRPSIGELTPRTGTSKTRTPQNKQQRAHTKQRKKQTNTNKHHKNVKIP